MICNLANGRTGELSRDSAVQKNPLILVGELREVGMQKGKPKILLSFASEAHIDWLSELFPRSILDEEVVCWNESKQVVEKRQVKQFRSLILEESISADIDKQLAARIMAREIQENELKLEGWNKDVKHWISRTRCVAGWFPEKGLTEYDESTVLSILEKVCFGERRYRDVRKKPCLGHVKSIISKADQRFVDAMAPEKLI